MSIQVEIVEETVFGPKVCGACNRNFKHNSGRQIYCRSCRLVDNCDGCKRSFQLKVNSYTKALSYPDIKRFCSLKCQYNTFHGPIDCQLHGHQLASLAGKCAKCNSDKVNGPIDCKLHGLQERSINNVCPICNNLKVSISITCEFHGYQPTSFSGKCQKCNSNKFNMAIFCEVHGHQETSFAGKCPQCFNGTLWLNNCDCKEHPYEVKQVLLGINYHCWSCIKDSFEFKAIETFHTDQMWIPTFRDNIYNAKGQHAMEQYLVEKNISWFTYIKFYINNDSQIVPLVVGKSGSKLVNLKGSDIAFMYKGDTPARSLLRDNGLLWDTTKILVIPAISDLEALKLEKTLANNHKLFYS